jgi:hypothetical protein
MNSSASGSHISAASLRILGTALTIMQVSGEGKAVLTLCLFHGSA